MKGRVTQRSAAVRRAPIVNMIATVSVFAIGAFIAAPSPKVHAASLTDVVTTPISTVQNVVAPTQTVTTPTVPVTTPVTPTTTSSDSTTSNGTGSTSGTSQTTQSAPTQSTTPSTTTPSSAPTTRTPVKEAGDQSVGDMSPIDYVSRQISKSAAGSLYVAAGSLALFGLIVYFVTYLPKRMARNRPLPADNESDTALRRLFTIVTLGALKPTNR